MTDEPVKYANKFNSIEDLEKGYNEAYSNNSKLVNEKKELSSKLEESTKIPDDYSVPEEAKFLSEKDINELKEMAKESQLTQKHFDKFIVRKAIDTKQRTEAIENSKKEIGEDQLNIVKDYVKKVYPDKLQETVLNKVINDKEALKEALFHREKILNTSVPGISNVSHPHPDVTWEDVKKAHAAKEANPKDFKALDRYIKINEAYAKNKSNP